MVKARMMLIPCLLFLLLVTSGCMYSEEKNKQNQLATGEFITVVQNAVDEFHKRRGVLPIKTKEEDTPLYEKYLIDFKKLKDYNVLSTIPGNAFENGGTALYVLVDVETSPKVKMMDLPSYQRMVDLQKEIDAYKVKNQGALPKGQPLAEGFSYIDYTKLKKKELSLQSPYSRSSLSAIMDDTGKVGIDYGPEIAKAMSRKGLASADPGKDLRSLLVEEGYFVPARSFPYTWKNGEPTVTRE